MRCIVQIWSGQTRETEQELLESPVAIASFHVQDQSERRLAIAAGANVYIFIGTKPHFKTTMPIETVSEQDLAVWYFHTALVSCICYFEDSSCCDQRETSALLYISCGRKHCVLDAQLCPVQDNAEPGF